MPAPFVDCQSQSSSRRLHYNLVASTTVCAISPLFTDLSVVSQTFVGMQSYLSICTLHLFLRTVSAPPHTLMNVTLLAPNAPAY
eukprot:6179163-Pleurochrysis_carterae.AAC.1